MASDLTKIRRVAERYAQLTALERILVPPFTHDGLSLLKLASGQLDIPTEAHVIAARLRSSRGVADTMDFPTKARIIWMALLDTKSPMVDMDSSDAYREAFVGRYAVQPIQLLTRNMRPEDRKGLRAVLQADAAGYSAPEFAAHYLDGIFGEAGAPGAATSRRLTAA